MSAHESDSEGPVVSETAATTPSSWHWVALAAIASLAGLSYGWAINQSPLEPYYEAAVRGMSQSWHNFAYGAFDPAGTITLDKLPGAFWLQALSVRVFGFHPWAMVLPQVVEGVLTVVVLFFAVRRMAGPIAGLIAAAVMAVSPATVLLNRGNISDSLMILLVVLAADATSRALTTGRLRTLLLAAFWVGLAFQAKMIEAWLVVPALGLTYLLAGPDPLRRRVRQLAIAGAATAVVSVVWISVVSLIPSGDRPAVDGSPDGSLFHQVFVYNGFGRFGDKTPLQVLAAQLATVKNTSVVPAVGPARLFHGTLGRDTGWLLPAALIVAAGALVLLRDRPRTDPLRASFVLWGVWLATLCVTFSVTTTLNAYYTAALTPAIAAILGAGVVLVFTAADRVRLPMVLIVLLIGSIGYAVWLTPTSGNHLPDWLRPTEIGIGVAAVVVATAVLTASVALKKRATLLIPTAAGVAIAGCLVAPTTASALAATHHQSAFDTPFQSPELTNRLDLVFVTLPTQIASTIGGIELANQGAPYLIATQTAALASTFIDASGKEALPIGGFDGASPSPTLTQLKADIAQAKFHLVLAAPGPDPRLVWISTHCTSVGTPIGALHNYYCTPADAR